MIHTHTHTHTRTHTHTHSHIHTYTHTRNQFIHKIDTDTHTQNSMPNFECTLKTKGSWYQTVNQFTLIDPVLPELTFVLLRDTVF